LRKEGGNILKIEKFNLLAIFAIMLGLLMSNSPAASNFQIYSAINLDSIVKYDLHASFSYDFTYVGIGAAIGNDLINDSYFQENFIDKIPNRQRPIELDNGNQYFYDLSLKYKLYQGAIGKLLVNFGYHSPLLAEKVLAFSDYSGIFPSANFGISYDIGYRNMEFLVGGSYSVLENTFRDRIRFSIENYYNIGKNTTAIFSYSYIFDVEKIDYSEPHVPYEKPDGSLINMEHDNIVYRVPKAMLLCKTHEIALYNTFRMDKNNLVKLGVKYSLYRSGINSYSFIFSILF
jgi:hypothetical protein